MQAEKLDPNMWFNNVERVAAARVGQEPVRYVRNIYKYYVAYKLIEEADAAKKGRDCRSQDGAGCCGYVGAAATCQTALTGCTRRL